MICLKTFGADNCYSSVSHSMSFVSSIPTRGWWIFSFSFSPPWHLEKVGKFWISPLNSQCLEKMDGGEWSALTLSSYMPCYIKKTFTLYPAYNRVEGNLVLWHSVLRFRVFWLCSRIYRLWRLITRPIKVLKKNPIEMILLPLVPIISMVFFYQISTVYLITQRVR